MRILLLFLLGTLALSGCKDSADEKPYKATTVDECIDEKECFRYVFLHEVIPNYANLTVRDNEIYRFSQWQDGLKVYFHFTDTIPHDVRPEYEEKVKVVLRKIQLGFTKRITQAETRDTANTEIIISKNRSDFESYILNTDMKFPSKTYLRAFKRKQNTLIETDNNKNTQGAIFVSEALIEDNCIFDTLSEYLGINEADSNTFALADYDDCTVSNLHFLFMSLIHPRKVKSEYNQTDLDKIIDDLSIRIEEQQKVKPNYSELLKMILRDLEKFHINRNKI